MGYLNGLFKYSELVNSPAEAHQWLAREVVEEDMVLSAHNLAKKHRPMMTTADLSLCFGPIYIPKTPIPVESAPLLESGLSQDMGITLVWFIELV